MRRREFFLTTAAASAAPPPRPNIVLVMMDDFGTGQFAPLAARLNDADVDPAFAEFLQRRNAGYTPAAALAMARQAMPEMTRLAASGVLFSNAFSPSNLCAPARCGVLTGQVQNRFGHYQNTDVEAAGLPPGSVLAERLQRAGYSTGFIGKWHAGTRDESLRAQVLARHNVGRGGLARLYPEHRELVEKEIRATGYLGAVVEAHHPLNHGFDYYFGYNRWECPFYDSEEIWENRRYTGLQKQYNTELFTDRAVGFIRRARSQRKPFFVQLCYHAVHGPLKPQAPERYSAGLPEGPYDLRNFYAHVNGVDAGVRALCEELGPEWDNTLFLFCADNGAPVSMATPLPGNGRYRGHKGTFYQGGIRVPMLLHWPAAVRGGQVRTELASLMDLMPTALDAAGTAMPRGLDGRSLLPLVRGQAASVHGHLVWAGIHARAWGFSGETTIGNAEQRREESPGAWVATDGRYLLRFVTATPAGLFRDLPDGAPAHYELFDLREDPGETRDLSAQIPQVAERLKAVFRQQARQWPKPNRWREDRWRELMEIR